MYKCSGNEQKVEQKLKTMTVMNLISVGKYKKFSGHEPEDKKEFKEFRSNNEIVVELLSIAKMLWK